MFALLEKGISLQDIYSMPLSTFLKYSEKVNELNVKQSAAANGKKHVSNKSFITKLGNKNG